MGFNLKKGEGFNIHKSISEVMIGLGWKAGEGFDLDAEVFGLIDNGGSPRVLSDAYAVCYANGDIKQSNGTFLTPDGSIMHHGDNRTGAGDGDDEMIDVNFNKLPAEISELSIFVTIYEGIAGKKDFGGIKESYVRVVDKNTGGELCKYLLRDEFAGSTAVQVGSFVKENGEWTFKAVGAGSKAELGDILRGYGVPV